MCGNVQMYPLGIGHLCQWYQSRRILNLLIYQKSIHLCVCSVADPCQSKMCISCFFLKCKFLPHFIHALSYIFWHQSFFQILLIFVSRYFGIHFRLISTSSFFSAPILSVMSCPVLCLSHCTKLVYSLLFYYVCSTFYTCISDSFTRLHLILPNKS